MLRGQTEGTRGSSSVTWTARRRGFGQRITSDEGAAVPRRIYGGRAVAESGSCAGGRPRSRADLAGGGGGDCGGGGDWGGGVGSNGLGEDEDEEEKAE
jgi:hypothetical protein